MSGATVLNDGLALSSVWISAFQPYYLAVRSLSKADLAASVSLVIVDVIHFCLEGAPQLQERVAGTLVRSFLYPATGLQHAVPGVHYAHEFRVPEL
jgi:hypothetical protein